MEMFMQHLIGLLDLVIHKRARLVLFNVLQVIIYRQVIQSLYCFWTIKLWLMPNHFDIGYFDLLNIIGNTYLGGMSKLFRKN